MFLFIVIDALIVGMLIHLSIFCTIAIIMMKHNVTTTVCWSALFFNSGTTEVCSFPFSKCLNIQNVTSCVFSGTKLVNATMFCSQLWYLTFWSLSPAHECTTSQQRTLQLSPKFQLHYFWNDMELSLSYKKRYQLNCIKFLC